MKELEIKQKAFASTILMDDEGKEAKFKNGDKVYFIPTKEYCTIVKQILSYDWGNSFWGDVIIKFENGETIECNNWQICFAEEVKERLENTAFALFKMSVVMQIEKTKNKEELREILQRSYKSLENSDKSA